MKKNRTNSRLILFLCMVEIGVGVTIAHEFLLEAISRKRILHPIEYSVSVSNIGNSTSYNEEDIHVDYEILDGADSELLQNIKIDEHNESDAGYANATCNVTHDLDAVTGQKIVIVNADESSHINQQGHNNTAFQAYDNDLSTSWQEGIEGTGIGSWLYYQFEEAHYITDVVIYAGVWREADGKDYYHDNCRPKELQITMNDLKWNVSFDDNKLPQVIHFSEPVPAQDVSITILDIYTGNKYEDLGIAEIAFYE